MTEIDPEAVAEAASQPGTFSFVDRLLGRNYPTTDVKLYLDEQAAFERLQLKAEAEAVRATSKEENVDLVERIDEVDKRLLASKYVITLQGFPPEQYDELLEEVAEQYPLEYEEHTNVFSGERTRTQKDNPDYMRLLWAKLWAKSIIKIVAPDGSVDESTLDVGTAGHIRANFPIDGRRKIDVTIQELRLTSQWIDSVQDEGFLATP